MAQPNLRILGSNILRLRKESRLTQEDVADRANLNASYYGRIERGDINVTIETLTSIARALNVDLQELLTAELTTVDANRLRSDIQKMLKRLDVHRLRLFRDFMRLL